MRLKKVSKKDDNFRSVPDWTLCETDGPSIFVDVFKLNVCGVRGKGSSDFFGPFKNDECVARRKEFTPAERLEVVGLDAIGVDVPHVANAPTSRCYIWACV